MVMSGRHEHKHAHPKRDTNSGLQHDVTVYILNISCTGRHIDHHFIQNKDISCFIVWGYYNLKAHKSVLACRCEEFDPWIKINFRNYELFLDILLSFPGRGIGHCKIRTCIGKQNTEKRPCLERDSNPRSWCLTVSRPYAPLKLVEFMLNRWWMAQFCNSASAN
jgi:hypothetical protein